MTNKETIENLLVLEEYLKRGYGKLFPQEYFDSISSAIEILSKPPLPDNLDEAADENAKSLSTDWIKAMAIENFKAGESGWLIHLRRIDSLHAMLKQKRNIIEKLISLRKL